MITRPVISYARVRTPTRPTADDTLRAVRAKLPRRRESFSLLSRVLNGAAIGAGLALAVLQFGQALNAPVPVHRALLCNMHVCNVFH
jgi:hypothetical protein